MATKGVSGEPFRTRIKVWCAACREELIVEEREVFNLKGTLYTASITVQPFCWNCQKMQRTKTTEDLL